MIEVENVHPPGLPHENHARDGVAPNSRFCVSATHDGSRVLRAMALTGNVTAVARDAVALCSSLDAITCVTSTKPRVAA